MSDPYIGEIRMFGGTFAPLGWAFCDGAVISIAGNDVLFAVIGTTYGGDGVTTFALPDLRGRLPIHAGTGPGLTPRMLGQSLGSESVTLMNSQLPTHQHSVPASGSQGSTRPDGAAQAPGGSYGSPSGASSAPGQGTGSGQPHENRQPALAINFIICLQGIYPSPS